MYRTMWDPEHEAIREAAQHSMESAALARQICYVYSQSPFYRRRFDDAGVTPDKVQDVRDISLLPFTTKDELRESQERNPPFGDYLAAPKKDLVRVHRTSGTTGRFIYVGLTRADIIQTNNVGARAFWAGGLRPHHTVVHCLNYSLWMGGYTDHSNLEATGATVIPFGVGNSRQLVRMIREAGVDAISATPSYPVRLEPIVREELGIDPRDLGLKLGLFGGEPALEDPNFKARTENTWGIRASNANYGLSEALCNFASVCDDVDALHFLAQGALIPQIIDPFSEEDLALNYGTSGELVLTNLDREAHPLIRYRTGDLIEVLATGDCRCSRSGFRFKVIGRVDDMLHVRGINVFPSAIAAVLNKTIPETTGEFQIVRSGPGPYERLDITVEHGRFDSVAEIDNLSRRIEEALKDTLSFGASITFVRPGEIPRTEMGKVNRVTSLSEKKRYRLTDTHNRR